MQLHDLKPRPGAKHRTKRLGCGESSGHGQTSGKGHKGQKARSGGSIRLGFEGGQMPLYRRLPKRGFNNKNFKISFAPVNLNSLEKFEAGTVIDEAFLREKGLVSGKWDGVKLLAGGTLSKKLTIKVNKASESAVAAIEKLGGKVEILVPRTPAPKADKAAA